MLRIIYKIGAIFLFVFIFSSYQPLNAQYKYSIDLENKRTRKVPLKFVLTQAKENRKIEAERRKNKRQAEKSSKKVRKHTYNIQTRAVKKRMNESRIKSEYYNTGKLPLIYKLKNIIDG